MQVQLATEFRAQSSAPAVARILLPGTTVLSVPNYGMPDSCHMSAQLVGTTGNRDERNPACAGPERGQNRVVRGRMPCIRRSFDIFRQDDTRLLSFA